MNRQEQGEPKRETLLLYDGECSFCQAKATHWEKKGGTEVNVFPVQGGEGERYGFLKKQQLESVALIDGQGEIFKGAAAIFKFMSLKGDWLGILLWWCYERFSLMRMMSEWGYAQVARHRKFLPYRKDKY